MDTVIKKIHKIIIKKTKTCAIEMYPLGDLMLSLRSYGEDTIDAHGHLSREILLDWRKLFSDGTQFLIEGEFEDETIFNGVYDLIAGKFIDKEN